MMECAMCGSIYNLQKHHVVPISCGGRKGFGNRIYACLKCHGEIHGKKFSGTPLKSTVNGSKSGYHFIPIYRIKNEIIKLKHDGWRDVEIAEKYGVSTVTIQNWRRKINLPKLPNPAWVPRPKLGRVYNPKRGRIPLFSEREEKKYNAPSAKGKVEG